MLKRLLSDIEREGAGYEIECLVVDDKSRNLAAVQRACKYPWVELNAQKVHHGKKNFWEIINLCFSEAQKRKWDYWFHMPDDNRLVNGFFDKAIRTFQTLPHRSILNPIITQNPPKYGSWTGKQRRRHGEDAWSIGWNDCCWVADRVMGEMLNWRIDPVHRNRWMFNSRLGSGVGKQITIRLDFEGVKMFQVRQTLMHHGDHASRMNPAERKANPLVT